MILRPMPELANGSKLLLVIDKHLAIVLPPSWFKPERSAGELARRRHGRRVIPAKLDFDIYKFCFGNGLE